MQYRTLAKSLIGTVILMASISWLIGGGSNTIGAVAAQTSSFDWSYPVRIAEREELTSEPFLIADQSGRLHYIWSPLSTNLQSLYYSQWDGTVWTEPVDIFYDNQITGPSAAVDSQGTIHLAWSNGNTIYYSQTDVSQAFSANNWLEPLPLVSGFQHPYILVDPSTAPDRKDRLYVFYPRLSSAGTAMIISNDNGLSWSEEQPISLTKSAGTAADYVRAVITDDGTIHVVWVEYQLPVGWPPTGLYYSRSKDGGETWSRPYELAGENYNQINIAADENGMIHTAWNGAAGTGGRYHRWSQDGGETWSNILTVVPPGEGGSEGPPQLAVDSLGTLHLVTTFGQRVWYAYFQGGRWSEPQYIPTGNETGVPPIGQRIDNVTVRRIEHPAMTISQGNQLHTIFWEERPFQGTLQYWYTTKQTSASPTGLIPFPTPTTLPTHTPSTLEPGSNAARITPTPLLSDSEDLTQMGESPALPIVIAVVLVVLLVSVILIFRVASINRKR